MVNGNDELAFSCGGEEVKHSSEDIKEGVGNEGPFPNLKEGKTFSARTFLRGADAVELTLFRENEGLTRVDRLRLEGELTCVHGPSFRSLTQKKWDACQLLLRFPG